MINRVNNALDIDNSLYSNIDIGAYQHHRNNSITNEKYCLYIFDPLEMNPKINMNHTRKLATGGGGLSSFGGRGL